MKYNKTMKAENEAGKATAEAHKQADAAIGVNWLTDGCQCAACRIVRKSEKRN